MGFGFKYRLTGGTWSRPYLEQYQRVHRWHQVLQKIRVSNAPTSQTDYQIDCILTFFVNCYHLKDWIKDFLRDTRPELVEELERLIATDQDMKICRHVCHMSKHLSLQRPPLDKNLVRLVREWDPSPGPKPAKNQRYSIVGYNRQQDPFELADRCVKWWDDFLKEKLYSDTSA